MNDVETLQVEQKIIGKMHILVKNGTLGWKMCLQIKRKIEVLSVEKNDQYEDATL